MRTAKPKRSSDCNSCARRSTLWTTIICRRFSPSLTITGSKLFGICGKRGWGSTGVGQTQNRGCGCCADWRKTTTGSDLQPPGNTTFRSIRRLSTSPSTLQRLSRKALKCLGYRVCERWDTLSFCLSPAFSVVSLNCRDEVLPVQYHPIRASQGTQVFGLSPGDDQRKAVCIACVVAC